jgi:CTP synthase
VSKPLDLSVVKALTHAAMATKQKLRIEWIEASSLCPDEESGSSDTELAWERLRKCNGIVVPGGFGSRGMEGKISTIQYARENKVPYLGICLGMQAAVIEHCRNVLGIAKAYSAEFSDDLVKDEEDAVIFMPEGDRERMGGTMRLGARETILKEHSVARQLYGTEKIMERHRHRYEVNPALVPRLEEAGLEFVGRNTDESGERMEVCELNKKRHPYFMAAQFHPEYTSRPEKANPLFLGLLQACKNSIATD